MSIYRFHNNNSCYSSNAYCTEPVFYQEYVADALLTSAKKEPSAPARCVALSSLGVWLYEELTSPADENCSPSSFENPENFSYDNNFSPVKGRILARHGRVKEAINVLLVSLKVSRVSRLCVSLTVSRLGFS